MPARWRLVGFVSPDVRCPFYLLFDPVPIGDSRLVASTILSRQLRSWARERLTISSAVPKPFSMSGDLGLRYTSAVSQKLMPASKASFIIAKLAGWWASFPKFKAPGAIELTFRQVRSRLGWLIALHS
jgi:hypothetical protein